MTTTPRADHADVPTVHALLMIAERATKEQATDDLAGNPSRWTSFVAVNAVREAILASLAAAPKPAMAGSKDREAVATAIRMYLRSGQTWIDDDGLVQGEFSLADAILALIGTAEGRDDAPKAEPSKVTEGGDG